MAAPRRRTRSTITAGLVGAAVVVAPAGAAIGVDARGLQPVVTSLSGPVRPAGDVNGDGIADLISAADDRNGDDILDEACRHGLPAGQVLLGGAAPRPVLLHCVPATTRASAGDAVGVGDVNGDGIDDIAVGAPGVSPDGRQSAGSVFVVFGTRDPQDIDLDTAGVRIDGPRRGADLGSSIVPVGDVNGDGRPDVALPYGSRVAIVFGGLVGGERVDLRVAGAAAATLTGVADDAAIAAAGDLDGDGRGEILIGDSERHEVLAIAGPTAAGAADVRRQPPVLRIEGVAGVDGDRLIRVGNSIALANPSFSGTVFVVPAQPGTIDLRHPPAEVLRVAGRSSKDDDRRSQQLAGESNREAGFGTALAPAGDVTGDGVGDLLVSAPFATPLCRQRAGAVYVIPGGLSGRLGVDQVPGLIRVDGPRSEALLSLTGQAAGDFSGDGRPELLLSAQLSNAAVGSLLAVPPVFGARPALGVKTCLDVALAGHPRRDLRRGRVRLHVFSDAGPGESHRVGVTVRVGHRRGVGRFVRFAGPGRRRVTLRVRPSNGENHIAVLAVQRLRADTGYVGRFSFGV